MLDIAWSEYLFIAILALILLGPNELPVVLRTIGRWVGKARQLSVAFQEQISLLEVETTLDTASLVDFSEEEQVQTYPLPSQPADTLFTKLPKAYPLPWT